MSTVPTRFRASHAAERLVHRHLVVLALPEPLAGEGGVASRELGEFEAKTWINAIVQAIRAVKADKESIRLQNEFLERSKHPLDPALAPE